MNVTANTFSGRVKAVTMANVMAEVVIETGGEPGLMVAAVPRSMVEGLNIRVGDLVTALVNPADIIVAKD